MITAWRVIKSGLRNLLRNAWLSTAATVVMILTITVVFFFVVANLFLGSQIKAIQSRIDISVFLNDDAPIDQVRSMQSAIAALPDTKSVKYVSKLDALAIYRGQNAGNQKLSDVVTADDNPLPASLEITARDPNNLGAIKTVVDSDQYKPLIGKSTFEGKNQVIVQKIIQASNFIKKVGLIASVLFMVISLLIIFNTIRMAIFTRREEIEIMRLVGATNWFIRWPFIIEAAAYGVIAALVSIVLSYAFLSAAGPAMTKYFGDTATTTRYLMSNLPLIAIGELLLGILIGGLSSLLAVSRYLRF